MCRTDLELSACEKQFVKDKLHVARTDSNRYKHICTNTFACDQNSGGSKERRTGQFACQRSPSYSAAKGDVLPAALLNIPSSCHNDRTNQLAG